MSHTWQIIKKDLHRTWLAMLLWWIVLALKTALPAWIVGRAWDGAGTTLYPMLELADLILLTEIVSRLVRPNSPADDCAHWRTAAISGPRLAATKIIFLGVFCWLASLGFALATKIIYRFPHEEWAGSLVIFAIDQATVLAGLFLLATIFNFRFALGAKSLFLYALLGWLTFTRPFSMLYFGGWPQTLGIWPQTYLWALMIGISMAMVGLIFICRNGTAKSHLRFLRVLGILAAICLLMVTLCHQTDKTDPLEETRFWLAWFLAVICALTAGILKYSNEQRIEGNLILALGLVATLSAEMLWPWALIAPRAYRWPEQPSLPPSTPAQQTGLTVRVTALQRNAEGSPPFEIAGELAGNITPSTPDEIWIPAGISARLVWPADTYLRPMRMNGIINSLEWQDNVERAGLGRWLSNDSSKVVELPVRFSFSVARLLDFQIIQVQEFRPRWEGQVHFVVGRIKRVADLPLKNGALTFRPALAAINGFAAGPDGRAYLGITTCGFADNRLDGYNYDGSPKDAGEMIALWNPKRKEVAIGYPQYNTTDGVNYLSEFILNGSSFAITNIGNYWAFNLPNNGFNGTPQPMSQAEIKAWLADARLIWLQYTPESSHTVALNIDSLTTPPLQQRDTPPVPPASGK